MNDLPVSTRPSSILALDIGTKRIGVARASMEAKLPQSLETITVDGKEIEKIKSLVEAYDIDTVVVGWPLNLSGEETDQTELVAKFIKRLEEVVSVRIIKQNEALTSVQAESELGFKPTKKKQKGLVDARAAVIIMDEYLRSMN